MPSDTSYQIDVSRHFLSLAEWPEADRLAWARALSSARLLEDGGAGAHWVPTPRK